MNLLFVDRIRIKVRRAVHDRLPSLAEGVSALEVVGLVHVALADLFVVRGE